MATLVQHAGVSRFHLGRFIAFLLRERFMLMLGLVVAVALAFANYGSCIRGGFYQDDYGYEKLLGHPSLTSWLRAMSPYGQEHFYRPTTQVYLVVMNTISPCSSTLLHIGSVVLFGFVIFLAGLLAYRLTDRPWLAFCVGILLAFTNGFAQAITWISSVGMLLGTTFSLLACLCWLKARSTNSPGSFAAGWLSLMLAMGSKEDFVAFPLALGIFDFYIHARLGRKVTLASFAAWAPLLLWYPFYGWAEMVGYRVTPNASDHIWEGGVVWQRVFSFATSNMSRFIANPFASIEPQVWPFAITTAGLAFLVRRQRLLLALLGMLVVAFLPAVLMTGGNHLGSERFNFPPTVWSALFWVVLLSQALASRRRLVRDAGRVGCLAVCMHTIGFTYPSDPFFVFLAAAGLGALIWLWPACRARAGMGLLFIAASQVIFYGHVDSPWAIWPVVIISGLAYAWLLERRLAFVHFLSGMLTAALAWPMVPLSCFALLIDPDRRVAKRQAVPTAETVGDLIASDALAA